MKFIRIIRLCAAGILLLPACSSESASTADTTSAAVGSSPVIVAPANADNPPVTMSGYVDTSATTQMK